MNILRNKLIKGRTLEIEEDITFEKDQYASSPSIKEIKSCHTKASVDVYNDDIVEVNLHILANLIVEDAYTLEPLPYKLDFEDELTFISKNDGETEGIVAPQYQIDLDKYILQGIIASLPLRIIKKSSSLPSSGKNYRVLTEEQLQKEKSKNIDPRFSALDDVKFDDED